MLHWLTHLYDKGPRDKYVLLLLNSLYLKKLSCSLLILDFIRHLIPIIFFTSKTMSIF